MTQPQEDKGADAAGLISDLQSRLAYQEDTLQALNNVVAEQDGIISRLQQQVQHLNAKLNELGAAFEQKGEMGAVGAPIDEKPPHY